MVWMYVAYVFKNGFVNLYEVLHLYQVGRRNLFGWSDCNKINDIIKIDVSHHDWPQIVN